MNQIKLKPGVHYELLDGLRGVAALAVVCYHIFEGYAFAGKSDVIASVNHGYLAVDFFFMLSGFVVSYAYNDRFKSGSMTTLGFVKRRLVRLHPMVVIGALLGALTFLIQGSRQWDGTAVSNGMLLSALVFGMLLIPSPVGAPREVRGNGEMYPLNGPCWSLFFEYLGNIVYALVLRRLSAKSLRAVCVVLAAALVAFAVGGMSGYGNIGVGWTLTPMNFFGGFLRMLCPFAIGMYLSKNFRVPRVEGAFWICSVCLIALFMVPYIGGTDAFCVNGIFESVCVLGVFPVIISIAASSACSGKTSAVCRFFGDISYPLYIVHYPFMYLFYDWLIREKLYTFESTWHIAIVLVAFNVLLAYVMLKFYETPVRKFLSKYVVKG